MDAGFGRVLILAQNWEIAELSNWKLKSERDWLFKLPNY